MKKKINALLTVLCPIATIAVLMAIWTLLYEKNGSEFIFPSLSTVARTIKDYISDIYFWQSLLRTLVRTVLSFLLSFALACALGVLSHFVPWVRAALLPLIAVMRAAPTVALMIILNLLLVSRTTSPIFVSVAVIFPMLYASVCTALGAVDGKLVEMAKLYRVPLHKRIFSLYVPSVTPYMIGECGAALAFNVKLTASAEIIAYTPRSLGGLLQAANTYIDIGGVMAVTIIIIALSLLLDACTKLIVFTIRRAKHIK